MNIKTIFRSLFKPQEQIQDEVVLKFLRVLEKVRAEELSCEELFTQLDEFVEAEVRSGDAGKIMPLIREHLDICPECWEEYAALLSVLENTDKP